MDRMTRITLMSAFFGRSDGKTSKVHHLEKAKAPEGAFAFCF
jgi:hypothetical protein